jgi:hypothetical protein
MATFLFRLRVEAPDYADLVPDVLAEVSEARAPHDDDEGALSRWLSHPLGEALDDVNAWLPDGFYAKIEDPA